MSTLAAPESISLLSAEELRYFAERHFDFVWRIVRRFGLTSAEADDVAQEVFVVVTRKQSQIQEGKERSYLFSVALQLARKARLRTDREQPWEEAFEGVVEPGCDELIDDTRARNLLDRALGTLPDELKEVLVLHDLEEVTMAEISEILDLAPGTVASRLRRARVAFKEAVTRLKNVSRS